MAKKVISKKQLFSFEGFDVAHYKNTEEYAKAVDMLYNQAIQDFAKLAGKVNINPNKPFSFNDSPSAKKAAQEIIGGLSSNLTSVISKGSRDQWLYACKKNDAFLGSILNTSKVPKNALEKYQDKNLDALSAFQNRKVNGMDLSQRVWNYTDQMRGQMELGIDIALGDGLSAQQLSRELRQYLVDPDKLFRRVRDKHGNLVLSKNAKAFHPGQGKYRSSYKNAMRLTRTEINMAYRESDQLRWQQLDFIVGFEVKLSNNHTLNGVPFVDICDDLAGKYPKTFKFSGWHPQCRCHAVPIMMERDEFNNDELAELKAAINGTEYKRYPSANEVTDLPDSFKAWAADNAGRSLGWKSQPYFIRNNFEGGTLAGAFKSPTIAPVKPIKPVKTEAQKSDIQNRWNTRVATNQFSGELQAIGEQYPDVESISKYMGKVQAAINNGAPVNDVSAMVGKLKNKVAVKEAWEVRRVENQLGKLIPDVKANIAQYGIDSVNTVYGAVEKKLAQFESLSLAYQQKKLTFEVKWIEDNKKYSTWKLAQDAYKKALTNVEYKIAKQEVTESLADAFKYAQTTMSKNVKAMADELNVLLGKNAPLATLESKSNALNIEVQKLKAKKDAAALRKLKAGANDPDAYSKARKDAALWAKTVEQADNKVRGVSGKVWQAATAHERDAAYFYTHTYSSINEPLRGVPYYGGKSLTVAKAKVPHLTSIIDKSYYDIDMWVQRGVDGNGFKGLFGVDINQINPKNLTSDLVGKIGTDNGFVSCGVAKGKGFEHQQVIYNIYCPRGTKMLYAEPFSQYGAGAKSSWDGISKQSSFGSEAEMILQRGTKFRITKAEYNPSKRKYFIDVEVIEQ